MAQSVFAREDTLFGICYALGEDFGFNPTYLRILFAIALFLSPVAAAGAYAGGAALVAFSRWIVPEPRSIETDVAEPPGDASEPLEELALAA